MVLVFLALGLFLGSNCLASRGERLQGTVKWFHDTKGFGFIDPDKEGLADLFVHFTAIITKGFKNLHEGQRVEFCVEQGPKGLQAVRVTLLEEETSPPPDEEELCADGSERERGRVKWFNDTRGHGFLSREEGCDLFVHFSSIITNGFNVLREGQEVEFCVEPGPKGLQAVKVRVVD